MPTKIATVSFCGGGTTSCGKNFFSFWTATSKLLQTSPLEREFREPREDFGLHFPVCDYVLHPIAAIEKKMQEFASRDLKYERRMIPKDEANAYFAARGEPLKVQLIEEKGGATVSCDAIDDVFLDFCTGPHVPSTGRLKAFKLLTTSNAYCKGDAQNQPMQRVYGTAFFSDSDLKAHLQRLEEAKKRDHRRLGRELGLFTFHPWAPGAAFWLAKGTTVYNLLADYMRQVLFPAGYVELKTPLIFNKASAGPPTRSASLRRKRPPVRPAR